MKKFYLLLVAMMTAMALNAADWYLVGASFTYNGQTYSGTWSDTPALKFKTTSDPDVLTFGPVTIQGEFKIKEAGTWNTSFGSNGSPVVPGVLYNAGMDGGNLKINGSVENAIITINIANRTILIEGQALDNNYDTVYLVGDINGSGWNESTTSYPMLLSSGSTNVWEGTYDFTQDNNYFKMKAGVLVYGTGGNDIQVELSMPYTAQQSGNAFVLGPGHYTFSFTLDHNADTGTLVVTGKAAAQFATVFFKNTAGWDEVYAYVPDLGDDFPGNEMDPTDETDIWRYDVPEGYDTIIFNDGTEDNQSQPCTVHNSYLYSLDNTAGSPYMPALAIYVRGDFNNWGTGEANLMDCVGSGTYQIHYDLFRLGSFKLGTADWSQSWGGDQDSTINDEGVNRVSPGNEYNAWYNAGVNYYLSTFLRDCTITLITPDNRSGKMTIKGTPVDAPESADLYLVGDINDWALSDSALKFKYNGGNTYLLEVGTLSGQFKINNGSWDDINLGADGNGEDIPSVDAVIGKQTLYQGSSVNLNAATEITDCTLTLEYAVYANSAILTIEGNAGVDNVIVDDANAPVEYYNLQGVRIAEPSNGLYIRVQGAKTEKVVIK